MSFNNHSNNYSTPRNRSKYNLRKSTTEQRIEIQNRLTNLRTARTEIDNQCVFLEDLLNQLDIQDDNEYEQNRHFVPPYSSNSRTNHQERVQLDTETIASHHSVDEISFQTAPTTSSPSYLNDSSFKRIKGICKISSKTTPPGFDCLGPYKKGDITQITNQKDEEYGKQGVVHKVTNCFVYFSHDRASYQRVPQNIRRIHISQYKPY